MHRLILLISLLATPVFAAHYAVILNGAPAGAASPEGRAAVAVARQRVAGTHTAVRAALRARGLRITGETDTLLNAVYVDIDPAQSAGLSALPGVIQVVRMKRFHRLLDHAEQLINVPAAWAQAGGLTNAGAGIKIAVIDTGIDASHPAFQDSSLTPPARYPICPATPDCAYTNNKIIVARSYVTMLNSFAATTSRPDDYSARDRVGHGTAVAMAAAGNTAVGPSDTITGVAPKAFLGNYKVFGSPGVNDFTLGDAVVAALEAAYNDGMDIAVLSLGAPALSGPLDSAECGLSASQACDPEATAVQNAVTAGMLVVVAAGNDGTIGQVQPGLGTIDSPGTAPGAITVAATTNSHNWSNQLSVNGLGNFHSLLGDGPALSQKVTGPLGDVAAAGDPQACTAPPPGSLSGLIVLVARGVCTFAVKVQNLQSAGATGAIITNNPGDDTLLRPSGLSGTSIPAAFIGYSDGQTIRAFLAAHSQASVSVDPNLVSFEVATYNQMTSFSSRGPVVGSGALKPDIGAVGDNLFLAGQSYDPNGELYTPNGFLVSQGTSFSTPQIAGVAALAKQALTSLAAVFPNNPTLQTAALKSAIVNSATQDVTEGGATASVLAIGAGKANAAAAMNVQLVASPSSISFGAIRAGLLPLTQQVQLTNIGSAPVTVSVTLNRRSAENNAQTAVSQSSLTIAAGQTGSFNLQLSGSVPAPGVYEGFVAVSGARNTLNIPYLYVVGDGKPYNLLSLAGNGDDGTVSQQSAGGFVVFRVVDQYGVSVPNVATTFNVSSGNGQLLGRSTRTDNYGLGFAELVLGSTPGANVYTATAGGLTATFTATGRLPATVAPNGAVNGASFQPGVAPGAYLSIFGVALAETSGSFQTAYLPLAIGNVTVSFDAPGISVPGRLTFVSPGQVNVQVPWELQGFSSVQMKVSVADSSGTVYRLPLAAHAPALFESQGIAAAEDENYQLIGSANPVAQGRVVQLFVNGMGPVTNQPASGAASPFAPNVSTVTGSPVTVTIGGLPAAVQFAGLSPGSIGLYQVNAVVPNTGAGLQTVVVSVAGVASPASHLPVK